MVAGARGGSCSFGSGGVCHDWPCASWSWRSSSSSSSSRDSRGVRRSNIHIERLSENGREDAREDRGERRSSGSSSSSQQRRRRRESSKPQVLRGSGVRWRGEGEREASETVIGRSVGEPPARLSDPAGSQRRASR